MVDALEYSRLLSVFVGVFRSSNLSTARIGGGGEAGCADTVCEDRETGESGGLGTEGIEEAEDVEEAEEQDETEETEETGATERVTGKTEGWTTLVTSGRPGNGFCSGMVTTSTWLIGFVCDDSICALVLAFRQIKGMAPFVNWKHRFSTMTYLMVPTIFVAVACVSFVSFVSFCLDRKFMNFNSTCELKFAIQACLPFLIKVFHTSRSSNKPLIDAKSDQTYCTNIKLTYLSLKKDIIAEFKLASRGTPLSVTECGEPPIEWTESLRCSFTNFIKSTAPFLPTEALSEALRADSNAEAIIISCLRSNDIIL